MCLVPRVCGSLANGIDETNAIKPLLIGELDLTNEVVEMCDERGQNKSCPVGHSRSHGIDDCSCEVGIEAVLRITLLVLWRCLGVWVHCECMRDVCMAGDVGKKVY